MLFHLHGVTQRQVVRSIVELTTKFSDTKCGFLHYGQIRSATNTLRDLHTPSQPRFSFKEFSII